MKTVGRRITLLCAGKPKREIVLPKPPFPEVGDTVTDKGVSWLVVGSETTDVYTLLELKAPAKAVKAAETTDKAKR